MDITTNLALDARCRLADTAVDLLVATRQAALNNEFDTADTIVVAVLRVLDAYEAIALLSDAHDIATAPDKPIPFHPVR